MSRLQKTLICLSVIFSVKAHAFIVAQYNGTVINNDKITHVVVAGRGAELGYMFQKTANTQIRKYADLYPDHQFLLITVEEKDVTKDIPRLRNWGYARVAQVAGSLNAAAFFQQISGLKKIASMDFFTHNSAQVGMNLDGSDVRLKPDNPGWLNIKAKLLPGSYVVLHGCNSGFTMAPALSQILAIPVLGSLAATGFQNLLDRNMFYRYDSDTPPVGQWASLNSVSFSRNMECDRDQGCLRMQSDSFPYEGVWGSYASGGLTFYKTFCKGVATETCLRGMAQQLKAFPSIRNLGAASARQEDYNEVLVDFLCPFKLMSDARGECRRGLTSGNRYFNAFEGKPLQCDLNGCQFEMRCDYDQNGQPIAGTCNLSNAATRSSSLVDEYQLYLSAFRYLRQ